MIHLPLKYFIKIIALMTLFLSAASCHDPGYRIEVQTGQQGQTELRRIPYTLEQQAAMEQRAKVEQTAAAAMNEPDFAQMQSLWPKLTVSQRAELIESAMKMAK